MLQKNVILFLLLAIFSQSSLGCVFSNAENAVSQTGEMETNPKSEIETKLNEFMQRVAAWGYTGNILIAKDGKIIHRKGYGLANRAERIPFTENTVVEIGSNVKDFTKIAALQLLQQGKLNLDDPITKYFENVPADKASITIAQLLNHTAGFRGAVAPDPEKISREEMIKIMFAAPLISEPGKEENYSNPGYSFVAAIIEKISGKSFEQYAQENIMKPAGMTKTGYVLPEWKANEIAHSYVGENDQGSALDFPRFEDGNSWTMRGNGGFLSTLDDMYKLYDTLLHTEKILPDNLKEKMFRQNEPIMWVGGNGAHYFMFLYVPAEKIVIIGASTTAEMRATELSEQILPLVRGREYKLPPQTIKADKTTLAKYEGTYKLSNGSELNIAASEGKLLLTPTDQSGVSLLSGIDAAYTVELNKLNERISRIVEGSSKGDFMLLFEAYGRAVPLEGIKARQGAFWQRLTQQFGAFKGYKILGTTSNQKSVGERTSGEQNAQTTVRFDFEKGSSYAQYLSRNGKLVGVRPLPKPSMMDFLPQTTTAFVKYDISTGETGSINFKINNDGSVNELVIGGNAAAKVK